MKAFVLRRYGKKRALQLADVPTPEGPTLRQLADQGVSILPALVRRLSRDDLQESSRPTSVKPKE